MKATETLNQYFKELENKDEFSGVVLITRGDTELYSGAFGFASRAWKIKNTLDIRFDTASITKLFTTVGTLQLIEKKLLTHGYGMTGGWRLEVNGTGARRTTRKRRAT